MRQSKKEEKQKKNAQQSPNKNFIHQKHMYKLWPIEAYIFLVPNCLIKACYSNQREKKSSAEPITMEF